MAATTTAQGTSNRPHGDHVEVDGVPTYYEVRGSGAPVLLLHGGLCTAETFDTLSAALAERYRVVVPDRIGHGRTPDVEGPVTYEVQARHIIGFMDALDIEAAHFAGWSDGALVGLLVALRRPLLVRKLALIDQFVSLDGARAGSLPPMQAFTTSHGVPLEKPQLLNQLLLDFFADEQDPKTFDLSD